MNSDLVRGVFYSIYNRACVPVRAPNSGTVPNRYLAGVDGPVYLPLVYVICKYIRY